MATFMVLSLYVCHPAHLAELVGLELMLLFDCLSLRNPLDLSGCTLKSSALAERKNKILQHLFPGNSRIFGQKQEKLFKREYPAVDVEGIS